MNVLPNSGGTSSVWSWALDLPADVGWYWFRVTETSPQGMSRLQEAILYVGRDETGRLRCLLPYPISVEFMGGEWAGPIPSPAYSK